jgi:cytoskeleton protein RodZ
MPDIGSTLREARMRARIDISEVEAQTKIRAKYLRAIENEEWDLLPGPVYAKSFLRTYGDYLGLDSRMLVDEFRRRYEGGAADHDFRPVASRPPRERDRRPYPRRTPSWLPIAIVVVLVVVVLGVVGTLSNTNNTTTPSKNAANNDHHHHAARHRTVTTPVKPPAPTSVTLHLVPTNNVYVCLVNAAGRKLINEQTFAVGQAIPTETAHKLLLTLGNNSVQMKVNGKVWPVAASPTAIRLMITPGGVRNIPDTQLPTCP